MADKSTYNNWSWFDESSSIFANRDKFDNNKDFEKRLNDQKKEDAKIANNYNISTEHEKEVEWENLWVVDKFFQWL